MVCSFVYMLRSQQIDCNEVILEESDIAKAIVNFVTASSIEILVVGASSKGGLIR